MLTLVLVLRDEGVEDAGQAARLFVEALRADAFEQLEPLLLTLGDIEDLVDALPADAKAEDVAADFKDGILTVKVPKAGPPPTKSATHREDGVRGATCTVLRGTRPEGNAPGR